MNENIEYIVNLQIKNRGVHKTHIDIKKENDLGMKSTKVTRITC